jgi:hypothetical protein
MTDQKLDRLAQFAQRRLEIAQAHVHRNSRTEAQIANQLATLRCQDSTDCRPEMIGNKLRAIGGDIAWRRWKEQQIQELNMRLARQRALLMQAELDLREHLCRAKATERAAKISEEVSLAKSRQKWMNELSASSLLKQIQLKSAQS